MNTVSRIFDIIDFQLDNHPIDEALVTKNNGHWTALSSSAYKKQVDCLSRGLLKLGINPGETIAVVTTANCSEWNILDMALLQIGVQNVPIYPTSSVDSYHYILEHSGSTYVFISDQKILKKVNEAKKGLSIKGIYSFKKIEGCTYWQSIFEKGRDKKIQQKVDSLKSKIAPDDLATLIYTSGTTGTPKAVMLSHRNLISNVLDSAPRVPFDYGTETALSFLPLCHVFERMLIYLYQYYSVSIHYAESIEAIGDNVKEVRPTIMTAVPRLLEKVYDAFYTKGNQENGLKRQLFHWALRIGKQYEPFQKPSWWYGLQLKLARRLVLSKWKEGLGGRLDLIVSGSAPLNPALIRIFTASNMFILEGYGLTETSPVIAVNTNKKEGYKIGTVGRPIDKVDVKIANDGEVLVKGPNVMKGYYKERQKTANSFSKDGYFHTGDIGKLDDDGFLKITDRKKQLFKTSGGKYISPQPLENKLKSSSFIERAVVIGEGEKMPAALIQPNFDYLRKWAAHKDFELESDSEKALADNPLIIDRIQKEIDLCNAEFGRWEQIKAFKLTPAVWTIKGGELTPTLKVKRKNVIKKYQSLYKEIYPSNY